AAEPACQASQALCPPSRLASRAFRVFAARMMTVCELGSRPFLSPEPIKRYVTERNKFWPRCSCRHRFPVCFYNMPPASGARPASADGGLARRRDRWIRQQGVDMTLRLGNAVASSKCPRSCGNSGDSSDLAFARGFPAQAALGPAKLTARTKARIASPADDK